MDEQELDSSMAWLPFGTKDAKRMEDQARRTAALGLALWGKTDDDLRRQLLAPHPEIPSGFDLADYRELQKSYRLIAACLAGRHRSWVSGMPGIRNLLSPLVVIGTERLTAFEARCEIVRRAIEFLEGQ
jgi:hypothetical protein